MAYRARWQVSASAAGDGPTVVMQGQESLQREDAQEAISHLRWLVLSPPGRCRRTLLKQAKPV